MRFLLLFALASMGCFSLGEEASLRVADTSPQDSSSTADAIDTSVESGTVDSGSVDSALDVASDADADVAPPPVPNLLFYSTDDRRWASTEVEKSGKVTTLATGVLSPGFTHLAQPSGNRLLLAIDAAGKVTTASIEAIEPGFTHLASFGDGQVLSYRASDGTLRVDKVGTTVTLLKTSTQSRFIGWTHMATTRSGFIVFYKKTDGSTLGLRWDAELPSAGTPARNSMLDWVNVFGAFESNVFFSAFPGEGKAGAFNYYWKDGVAENVTGWGAERNPLPNNIGLADVQVGMKAGLVFYRKSAGTTDVGTLSVASTLFLDLVLVQSTAPGPGFTHAVALE